MGSGSITDRKPASSKSGASDLPEGCLERVTSDGGDATFESVDGKALFYMKGRFSPLFARPVSGGPGAAGAALGPRSSFLFPAEDGIYYIGQSEERIRNGLSNSFNFSSRTSRVLAKIDGFLSMGLSVSPDRQTLLFSRSAAIRTKPDDDRGLRSRIPSSAKKGYPTEWIEFPEPCSAK